MAANMSDGAPAIGSPAAQAGDAKLLEPGQAVQGHQHSKVERARQVVDVCPVTSTCVDRRDQLR